LDFGIACLLQFKQYLDSSFEGVDSTPLSDMGGDNACRLGSVLKEASFFLFLFLVEVGGVDGSSSELTSDDAAEVVVGDVGIFLHRGHTYRAIFFASR
jgi:hypothetical protein